MVIITKTRKVGGSIVVTLPKEIVDQKMLLPEEYVEIELKKIKKDYFGAFKGIGRFKGHEKWEHG